MTEEDIADNITFSTRCMKPYYVPQRVMSLAIKGLIRFEGSDA
jgi:hypothetical protein